jgi:hypothetical protein
MQDAQGDGVGTSTMPAIDTTPEIRYVNGRAASITTYCNVNNWTRSEHTTRLDEKGNYLESCFDEHHCISRNNEPVSRERLQELDHHNPHCIPVLSVLGTRRDQVEELLYELGMEARHI